MIAEMEAPCRPEESGRKEKLPRHPLDVPELTRRRRFYPLGFPVELRTNRTEVLQAAARSWGQFEESFETEPIGVDVHVIDSESVECPPTPSYSIMTPLVVSFADAQNYSVVDMQRGTTQVVVSTAALRHDRYFRYFFLEAAAAVHVAHRFTTPVHGACVALNGRGVLLCGESGAGKSTLAYACARAGWQYVSDDATQILHGTERLIGIGNCHQVRLRPSAAELFPEIRGLEVTPRAAGKPSIELRTADLPEIVPAKSTEIAAVVFLNREHDGAPGMNPYSKDAAREFMQKVFFGPQRFIDEHCRTIERLLGCDVLELRYTELGWARERLRKLLQDGC